ncbi:MAG: FKBP-type peptidyl-prolyl cis-trans isomerase [Litorivicinus sp.]
MNKLLTDIALSAATMTAPALMADTAAPATDDEKLAYALGVVVGERIFGDFGVLDYDQFLAGVKAAGDESSWALSRDEIGAVMQSVQQRVAAEQARQAEAASAEIRAEGEAYLAANAEKDGVTVTDSGLQYRYLTKGDGAMPAAESRVKVHYTGRLIDGTVFDSSVDRGEPVEFQVNQLIQGWIEALQLMKVGDKLEITVPFDIAYGPAGAPPSIPPFATLVFEMELLDIVSE